MDSPSRLTDELPPFAALLQQETVCLERCLIGVADGPGVLVDATPLAPPAARRGWLHLRCTTRDCVVAQRVLPVASGAAEVVILRHALEVAPEPRALLSEALRVLAPGGVLLVAGLHPWSAWRPWLAYQSRHGAPAWRARAPRRLAPDLAAGGMVVQGVERFGSAWPGQSGVGGGPLAAAYLLRASKQRLMPTAVGLDMATRRASRRAPALVAARRSRA